MLRPLRSNRRPFAKQHDDGAQEFHPGSILATLMKKRKELVASEHLTKEKLIMVYKDEISVLKPRSNINTYNAYVKAKSTEINDKLKQLQS